MNYTGYFMFQFINSKSNDKNDKKIILEPLSTILRLILFTYKEKGTKISIYNNAIYYNDPGLMQGVIRNISGDTRNDLHNLYYPILKSFQWYDYKNTMFNYFYNKSIMGLTLLLSNYDSNSIVHHTLTHYINNLNEALSGKEIIIDKDVKESPLLDYFQSLWKNEELDIVYKTFLLLEESNEKNEIDIYIQTIDTILSMKEKKVKDYIDKMSSSYN
jgi:hypothetical protein